MYTRRLNVPTRALFALAGFSLLALMACGQPEQLASLSPSDSTAIADTLRAQVRAAYDLSPGDVVTRMMSVYAEQGPVVSATAGRTTTSRDSLQLAVRSFWDGVGQYMIQPRWTWDTMLVDVLDRNTAVMTAQYTVPHHTDVGRAHVIGGAWTTVWQRSDNGWRVTHEHLSDMPRAVAERLEAGMARRGPAVDSAHRH